MLKLNGGLGTSMGMTKAKSLLEVKDGLTFLDVIVRQVLHLRERHGARIPLLLMNSFATRDDTLAALERYPELRLDDLPLDFMQGKVPKLLRRRPTSRSRGRPTPSLEWAPPGHGDVFTSLGVVGHARHAARARLRATCSCRTRTTSARCSSRASSAGSRARGCRSCRGRWTARRPTARAATWRAARDGGLVLRETAQVPEDDQEAFEDTERHRFFNANNIWVDLRALKRTLDDRDGVLGLPMIVNRKTVDPSDSSSPEVLQLETAMGAAIGVFDGASALHVPRAPVRAGEDDQPAAGGAIGRVRAGGRLDGAARRRARHDPGRRARPTSSSCCRDFEARFPGGPPSLVEAERLEVDGRRQLRPRREGKGRVHIDGPAEIPDGAVLEG